MYPILLITIIIKGLFVIGHILVIDFCDNYICSEFLVAMLQYEAYSKLMNGVFLLEYGVFIR